MQTPRAELEAVLAWTKARLAQGEEPPWAWFQLMKLREAVEGTLAATAATTTVNSPQSADSPGKHLRLVDSNTPQDDTQPHLVGLPTQTPM